MDPATGIAIMDPIEQPAARYEQDRSRRRSVLQRVAYTVIAVLIWSCVATVVWFWNDLDPTNAVAPVENDPAHTELQKK